PLYPLSLHDALPISFRENRWDSFPTARIPTINTNPARKMTRPTLASRDLSKAASVVVGEKSPQPLVGTFPRLPHRPHEDHGGGLDRKSTRLNSSHVA